MTSYIWSVLDGFFGTAAPRNSIPPPPYERPAGVSPPIATIDPVAAAIACNVDAIKKSGYTILADKQRAMFIEDIIAAIKARPAAAARLVQIGEQQALEIGRANGFGVELKKIELAIDETNQGMRLVRYGGPGPGPIPAPVTAGLTIVNAVILYAPMETLAGLTQRVDVRMLPAVALAGAVSLSAYFVHEVVSDEGESVGLADLIPAGLTTISFTVLRVTAGATVYQAVATGLLEGGVLLGLILLKAKRARQRAAANNEVRERWPFDQELTALGARRAELLRDLDESSARQGALRNQAEAVQAEQAASASEVDRVRARAEAAIEQALMDNQAAANAKDELAKKSRSDIWRERHAVKSETPNTFNEVTTNGLFDKFFSLFR